VKILLALALACSSFAARAQTHEVPSWFAESFLEFPQDVKEAAQERTDGRTMREKALARALNIRGTPTLLFLDEKGSVVLRLVGYVPPERLLAALAEAKTR
jgi:thioredoxin-related protein